MRKYMGFRGFVNKLLGDNEKKEEENIAEVTAGTQEALTEIMALSERLHREATNLTPKVSYNGTEKSLCIQGKSVPDNSEDFWKPIHEKLADTRGKGLIEKIIFDFDYFNTSSSKHILFIMSKDLENDPLSVVWYYEKDDTDMLEAGEDYASILPHITWECIEKDDN